MVSLAARQPTLPADHSLRRSAIWYPDVPSSKLSLNEGFLVAPRAYTSGYRPLFWTSFGGPGGVYLASLVKISVIGVIDRIDFTFNNAEVPVECRSFGRIRDRVDNEGDDSDEVVEFPIDGPGGEIVDRVEVHQELFLEDSNAADFLCREGLLALSLIHI